MSDIASALSGSLASDGQTPATGNLNMANNRIINMTDPTNAQDAVTVNFLSTGTYTINCGTF
jgi:hypothetical protein